MTRVRAADFNAAATTSNAITSPHRLLAAPSEIPTAWGAASSTPNVSVVTMAGLCLENTKQIPRRSNCLATGAKCAVGPSPCTCWIESQPSEDAGVKHRQQRSMAKKTVIREMTTGVIFVAGHGGGQARSSGALCCRRLQAWLCFQSAALTRMLVPERLAVRAKIGRDGLRRLNVEIVRLTICLGIRSKGGRSPPSPPSSSRTVGLLRWSTTVEHRSAATLGFVGVVRQVHAMIGRCNTYATRRT